MVNWLCYCIHKQSPNPITSNAGLICAAFTGISGGSVISLVSLVSFGAVQNVVIDTIKREGPSIDLAIEIGMRLDSWRLAIFAVSRPRHNSNRNLFAVFIEVEEVIISNLAISIGNRLNLRCLPVLTLLHKNSRAI